MGKLLLYIFGFCELEIVGAAPQWALNRLASSRIAFWDVEWLDELTVRIRVRVGDTEQAKLRITGAMCESKILRTAGIQVIGKKLIRRPVLLFSLGINILLLVWLSNFVLFYHVVGNEAVPDEAILRTLEGLGVGFGQYGPDIDPQAIKDHVLNLLPELSWITVTQSGCRATVVVREKPETEEIEDRKGFGHIVASQSGVITKQEVYVGQSMVEVGDAVLEGELLVSGMVNLDRVVMLRKAKAEIFAMTTRQIAVEIPIDFQQKCYTGEVWRCVWLTIGQKRIKIFGNSGISCTDCDKMIETKKLTLPDGFELPITVLVESFYGYTTQEQKLPEVTAQVLLSAYAQACVSQQMIAGEILHTDQQFGERDGCYVLDAQFACQEMIALPVQADETKEEQNYDGTNS